MVHSWSCPYLTLREKPYATYYPIKSLRRLTPTWVFLTPDVLMTRLLLNMISGVLDLAQMMRIHSRYVLCWCVCNAPYKWLAPWWDIIGQVVWRNSSKMLSRLSWLERDHEYWNAMQTAITSQCPALIVRIMTTNVMNHDAYWNFTTWQLKGWKLCQAARPSEDPAAQSWPHYVATQSNASCIFMHCLTLWRLPNRSSAFTSTSLGCQCPHAAHPHIH